jgi:hypothetical protein
MTKMLREWRARSASVAESIPVIHGGRAFWDEECGFSIYDYGKKGKYEKRGAEDIDR